MVMQWSLIAKPMMMMMKMMSSFSQQVPFPSTPFTATTTTITSDEWQRQGYSQPQLMGQMKLTSPQGEVVDHSMMVVLIGSGDDNKDNNNIDDGDG